MKKKKNVKNQIKGHVKGISSIVVGLGVAELMGYAMKDFKPDAKGIKKALIKIGAVALTGMIIKAATDYVDQEIDDIFDMADEVVIKLECEKEERSDEK